MASSIENLRMVVVLLEALKSESNFDRRFDDAIVLDQAIAAIQLVMSKLTPDGDPFSK